MPEQVGSVEQEARGGYQGHRRVRGGRGNEDPEHKGARGEAKQSNRRDRGDRGKRYYLCIVAANRDVDSTYIQYRPTSPEPYARYCARIRITPCMPLRSRRRRRRLHPAHETRYPAQVDTLPVALNRRDQPIEHLPACQREISIQSHSLTRSATPTHPIDLVHGDLGAEADQSAILDRLVRRLPLQASDPLF